jgi:guanylate kinase
MGHMKKGELFVVSAPSGAGKTTLCKMICERLDNLVYSVSYTTRPARPGEENGRDYFFVDEEEFDKMVRDGEFLEWAQVYQWRYGTSRRWIQEAVDRSMDVILDIDVQGAREIRRQGLPAHFIFVLPPTLEDLEARLISRGTEGPEEIEARLRRARDELMEWRSYDYVILNDELQVAAGDLASVIRANRCRRERVSSWIKENWHRWDVQKR